MCFTWLGEMCDVCEVQHPPTIFVYYVGWAVTVSLIHTKV